MSGCLIIPVSSTETPISIYNEFEKLQKLNASLVKDIDVKEVRHRCSSNDARINRIVPELEANASFLIVDVPQRKHFEGKQGKSTPSFLRLNGTQELWSVLSGQRTAKLAMNRVVFLHNANTETAFLCTAATQGHEQSNMAEFFERHSRYETYLFDTCAMVSNKWETEVHLSFYKLLVRFERPSQGLPPVKVEPFPGGQGWQIARATAGFRFDGDFFDHHWTCHVLGQHGTPWDALINEDQDWRQRKVLEVAFFGMALHQSTRSTDKILKEIKSGLKVESGSFSYSVPSSKLYSSWSTLWRVFDPLVQALKKTLPRHSIWSIYGRRGNKNGGKRSLDGLERMRGGTAQP